MRHIKSNYDLHKEQVFKDDYFWLECGSLINELHNKYPRIFSVILSEIEGDISLLKLQFQVAVKNKIDFVKVDDDLKSQVVLISSRYCLPIKDIDYCLNYILDHGTYEGISVIPHTRAHVKRVGDKISIELDHDTSLADIREAWPTILEMRKMFEDDYKPTKVKANERPEVVYEIFKMLRDGDDFSSIAKLYNSSAQFFGVYSGHRPAMEPSDLKKFYDRYKPGT